MPVIYIGDPTLASARSQVVVLLSMLLVSLMLLYSSLSYYLELYEAIYGIEVSVTAIRVIEASQEGGQIELLFSIDNPSSRTLTLAGAEGRIFLDGKFLAPIEFPEVGRFKINPRARGTVLRGKVYVDRYRAKILMRALSSGKQSWFVEAWLHIKVNSLITIYKVAESVDTKLRR